MVVALTATWGGADASTLLPLLQPAAISATAVRPTPAAWRYAIVLMGFLSRLAVVWVAADHHARPGSGRTTRLGAAGT